jgi:hypothetical protein
MQCYKCGATIPVERKACPSCGSPRSRLIYVPFWGVIGGIVGSLLGFTFWSTAGALAGGLLGIVVCEVVARLRFQKRSKA